jgi:hypothetical protein
MRQGVVAETRAMNARTQRTPSAAVEAPATPTLRLRRLYDLEADDGETVDELTEAQVDAVLMPRPLPMAGEAANDAGVAPRRPREGAGLRWGIAFSIAAWLAIVAWALAS